MEVTATPYSTKEIITNLNIGESTLRKWCLALEEQNYSFIRTDQNKRLFTSKDLLVLAQFKMLVQEKNMSIHNTAAIITSKYVKDPFSNGTEEEQLPALVFSNETLEEQKKEVMQLVRTGMEQLNEAYEAGIVELTKMYKTEIEQLKEENRGEVEQLKEMNRQLLTRLEEQHEYIENRFNATDQRLQEREKQIEGDGHNRDQLLMQAIRESQETKKLLLAMKEEQQQKKTSGKGLFRWFAK